MTAEELIQTVIEWKLIESTDEINWLFTNYPIVKNTLSLEENIKAAIQWAYDNDELDDFYLEHDESFMEEPTIGCSMYIHSGPGTYTRWDLYQFESKNKYYFRLIGSGEYAECIDSSGLFDVVDKKQKQMVIDDFKSRCEDAFAFDGVDGDVIDDGVEDRSELTFDYYS